MNMNEYQELAKITEKDYGPNKMELTNNWKRLVSHVLGVAGEAGEVANYVKKGVFHEHGIKPEKIKDELGDILWYVALIAETIHISLEDVAQHNVAKLKKRYPEGFSVDKSINREE